MLSPYHLPLLSCGSKWRWNGVAWARCHDIPTLRGVTIRAALEWRGVGFRSGFGVAWNYQNQFNSNSIQFQFLSNPGGVAWRGGFGWGLLRRGVGHATPESQVALAGIGIVIPCSQDDNSNSRPFYQPCIEI